MPPLNRCTSGQPLSGLSIDDAGGSLPPDELQYGTIEHFRPSKQSVPLPVIKSSGTLMFSSTEVVIRSRAEFKMPYDSTQVPK